jgi:hypothetical protein
MKQRELHRDDDGGGESEAQEKAHKASEKATSPWMT